MHCNQAQGQGDIHEIGEDGHDDAREGGMARPCCAQLLGWGAGPAPHAAAQAQRPVSALPAGNSSLLWLVAGEQRQASVYSCGTGLRGATDVAIITEPPAAADTSRQAVIGVSLKCVAAHTADWMRALRCLGRIPGKMRTAHEERTPSVSSFVQ